MNPVTFNFRQGHQMLRHFEDPQNRLPVCYVSQSWTDRTQTIEQKDLVFFFMKQNQKTQITHLKIDFKF